MCRTIRAQCETLSAHGICPTLRIVRVGNRHEDIAYEWGVVTSTVLASHVVQVARRLLERSAT